MTAAHCSGSESYDITLGTVNWAEPGPNAVVINAPGDFPHEDYESVTMINDIALIKLPENAPLSDCK